MEHHSSSDQQQNLGQAHLNHLSQESGPAGLPFEQPEYWKECTPNLTAQEKDNRTAKLTSETNNSLTQFHEQQQQSKSTDASTFDLTKMFQNYNSANVPVKRTSNQGSGKYGNFSGFSRVVIEELTNATQEHVKEVTKLGPPKISATIQLFHSHCGNTIKAIEADFKTLLKNRLKSVDFVKCNQHKDIDPSKILIVLCIITSRVGTDAAYAIKSIDTLNPANTVLLLVHVKDSHALSKQASSSFLNDEVFRSLGGIFDLAFVSGRGIYQCEMNDTALDGVCSFITQNMLDTN